MIRSGRCLPTPVHWCEEAACFQGRLKTIDPPSEKSYDIGLQIQLFQNVIAPRPKASVWLKLI
jgi:hypothetical protein